MEGILVPSVITTDKFVFMSCEAQALYLQLCAHANELGIVYAPKAITRGLNVSESNLDELEGLEFIAINEDGIATIADLGEGF